MKLRLINRNVCYAVRAVGFIAKSEKEVVSVTDLAKSLKVPKPFLRKILQVLNKKGILKSYKGKKGGFSLYTPINKIFLLDLMDIFQGKIDEKCPYLGDCELHKNIENIKKYVIDTLKGISLEIILENLKKGN